MRTAKASPISSSTPPIRLVIARLRHSGLTSELSAMPAATVQPVSDDRTKVVISGVPSSDTVGRVASRFRTISAYSDGAARLPMRLLRVWNPREIDAVAVENRNRPVLARTLLFDDGLENLERRAEGNVVEDLAVAKHRHVDVTIGRFLHRADEQI